MPKNSPDEMKYLMPLLLLIVSLSVCSSQTNNERFDVISTFNDSIESIVEGKEFLYYIRGHHVHNWSLVFSENGRYILVSGNTRNNDCRIDTISAPEPILAWGMDSLAIFGQNMKPIDRDSYRFFYERLVLFSPQKEIIFDCSDTDTYSGTDSVAFNQKLNGLKYFMYWHAVPKEVQEKLPAPHSFTKL